MFEDVAACRRCLAERGYITVPTGPAPLPKFEIKDLPPAMRKAVMTSGEPWAGTLLEVLAFYAAMQAAQRDVMAAATPEGGAADA